MRPSRTPTISTTQIYAARRVRAALDESERAKLEAARDQLNEVLGAVAARETGAQLGGWPILARRLPRTMADVARTYYATQEGTR